MQLELCVINLDRATDRWDHSVAQLDTLGLEATRLAGVDGRAGWHPLCEKYSDKNLGFWRGRPLTATQLGCYASHYKAWEYCVERQMPMIILEDDVRLDGRVFKQFIDNAKHLPEGCECVRLFNNRRKKVKKWEAWSLVDDLRIVKHTRGGKSGMGYFLTPSGAEKLLRANQEWFLPVDVSMDRFWINGVEWYALEPPCVFHNGSFESNIGGQERNRAMRSSLRFRARREWFAFQEQWRRVIWNLVFLVRRSLFPNRLKRGAPRIWKADKRSD